MDPSDMPSRPDPGRLLDALPDVVLALDDAARVVYVNDAALRMGWRREEWLGRSAMELLHPEDLALAMSSLTTVSTKEVGSPIDVRVAHPVAGWRWFEVIGADRWGDPSLGVLVLACRDLTDRRRWELAQGDASRVQAVVHHAAAITMLVDAGGRIDSVSGAVSRMLGHDPELLCGLPLGSLASPGYDDDLARLVSGRHRGGAERVEVFLAPADGTPPRPFRFESVDLCDDPVVRGFVVTAHDVSDLHAAREALERLATHDALTGVPNRVALPKLLGEALRSRAPGSETAVLFIDLDRFKPVNDLLGHDAGDELLVQFARRLSGLVRDGDAVVRMGGDEFVVVARGIRSLQGAETLAHTIELTVAEPFVLRAGVAHVTASVGLVLAEEGSSVSGVLADADNAMYQVKAGRRNSTMKQVRKISERRRLAGALSGALDRGEIEAWFQPVVAVPDGELLGFETLARWRSPGGVLPPGGFFDVAEELGMGTAIDLEMLRQAVGVLAGLGDAAAGAWVSVNMTAADLAQPGLVAAIVRALEAHRIEPHRLAVEVTEQTMLERSGVVSGPSPQAAIREIAALGVRVVLDDFGTGYSSLTHVRQYRLNALKIDRSFVSGIAEDRADRSVVAAVVGLAHALGLTTVAEGVETAAQMAELAALGCDAAQGYLVARPLAAVDLPGWLSARMVAGSRLSAG